MEGSTILAYLGTLGFGSLLGIFIKSVLDRAQEKRKLLFESRVKAYSGISGRMTNLFLAPDITSLPRALRFARINALLSEAYMLGSQDLHKELSVFTKKLNEFHDALEVKDDSKQSKLHPELVQLVTKVHREMRKDLFLPPVSRRAKLFEF